MSAFSVEIPHDGKTFENYTRFEWGVEVGVVNTFMLRLFVPHEFDMFEKNRNVFELLLFPSNSLEDLIRKRKITGIWAQTVDIYSALVSNRRRRRNGKVLNGLSTLIHSHRSQQISNVGV